MHSPQGWRKCGGRRVNNVQGGRRGGTGGEGGWVEQARPANRQPAVILFYDMIENALFEAAKVRFR